MGSLSTENGVRTGDRTMNYKLERELNNSLTHDLNDFIELTEARKENRKELLRTILSGIAMIVGFGLLVLTAISLEQPDVPSTQKEVKEVKI